MQNPRHFLTRMKGEGHLHDGFTLKKGAWPSRVRAPFLAAEENKE